MKKVLLTNVEIVQFTGSEINCITIAKRFKQLGYEVYIGALDFREPLLNQIKDSEFNLINLLEDKFDFSKIEFDIVWAQHSFLLDWLIFVKNIKAKKVISSSLSPKENLECLPLYANDLNMIIANSFETKKALEMEGAKNVELFENYSFESYFKRIVDVKELKNIAVVSNHIPEEEKEAIKLLKEKGYNVDIYGVEGKRQFITDEVLSNYDAIITIGKTVQYAMSLAIPVFIYDKHGGPGYLTTKNIEKSREKNFSGRGYEKKNAIQICQEVETTFNEALKDKEIIKQYAYENFCFEKIFDKFIKKIEQTQDTNLEKLKESYEKFNRNIKLTKTVADYMAFRTTISMDIIISKRDETIRYLDQEIQKRDKKIASLEDSRFVKLYIKIKKLFKKRGI